jgi:competence protein ComEA
MSSDELQDDFDEFESGNSDREEFNLAKLIEKNKISVILAIVGVILAGFGVVLYKNQTVPSSDNIEVLNSATEDQEVTSEIVVEIAGAVENPGVYKLKTGDRIDNLLTVAGGLLKDADMVWVDKYINRAAKLSDGQKLYIFSADEQSESVSANNLGGSSGGSGVLGSNHQGLVNINTSDFNTLDTLPGIGQVYGQSIIEHRPYSDIEELVSKDVLPQATLDKIKDKISVY